MDDQQLRALVREAIARHAPPDHDVTPDVPTASPYGGHASHFLYRLVNPSEACVIEPTVRCNHCGYCKSHGH